MIEYPRWKYTKDMTKAVADGFKGKDCVGRIVMNAQQDAALGEGWFNTPTECDLGILVSVEEEPEQDEATQKARLWAIAAERKIKIDKRWNIEKLIEAIEE